MREARAAAEARKRAVFQPDGDNTGYVPLLLVGFDVDQKEIVHAVVPLQQAARKATRKGSTVEELTAGAFLDGLLVGLFLARAREADTAEAA